MTTVQGETVSGHPHADGLAGELTPPADFPAPAVPERAEHERRDGGGFAASAATGLVTSAKTGRVSETAGQSFDLGTLWAPSFPGPELVTAAAGLFTKRPPWNGHEGPRPRLVIAPGVVSLEAPDMAKRERALEREQRRRQVDAEILGAWLHATGEFPADAEPSREITGWSRRSRSRMIRRLAELDWTPILSAACLPCMITLTYPGDWLTVAPDGETSKEHINAFYRRYFRAWGTHFVGPWKFEFQHRGAPHYHLYCVPPQGIAGETRKAEHAKRIAEWQELKARGIDPGPKPRFRKAIGDGLKFAQWLSITWADIVDHPDPEQKANHLAAGTGVDYAEGMRTSDPKRLAVYFAKHGIYADKEYQNRVPEEWQAPGKGPGRFWGYRGLSVLVAQVEIEWPEYQLMSRTLRKLAARTRIWDQTLNDGKGGHRWVKATRAVEVPRRPFLDPEIGEVGHRQFRKVRRPVKRFIRTSGFLCVNDGPALASTLSRLRESCLT
ncbi:hypothetical protein JHN61_32840 [Streptomyces sp. MBT67]|uniref:rolling circle replication-associated protein n=1 Tax=Streptomyces sp. MBT67 TaxID=1488397 RepID=UPI00190AA1E9|nr:hypothetical protein [Streptomyces sp. MBT67]MBK3540901.1 hypothetical protein [Streptomyces sp. MBT67]